MKAFEVARVVCLVIAGMFLGICLMGAIMDSWRPVVTRWRAIPEAPWVQLPTEIKWKGGLYDCVPKVTVPAERE